MTANTCIDRPTYLMQVGFCEHRELKLVREETAQLPVVHMLLAPEQAQLMALLARLLGVRRYLEIGTYTGYGALAIVLALSPTIGSSLAKSTRRSPRRQRHWASRRCHRQISKARTGAHDTRSHTRTRRTQRFDMAFINADKKNLLAYYERCHALVRVGGSILIDNTL